jgi:hypothetical protein
MDFSNKEFVLRNMRNIIDSPAAPNKTSLEHQGLSPMSGLALDLGGASLNASSPRRRLSLCSVATSSPSPLNLHRKLLRGKYTK